MRPHCPEYGRVDWDGPRRVRGVRVDASRRCIREATAGTLGMKTVEAFAAFLIEENSLP